MRWTNRTDARSDLRQWLRRVLRTLDFKNYSGRTRVVVTLTTVIALSIGVVVSWERLGLNLSELRLVPVLVIILTAPLTFVLSAMEYLLLAKAVGSTRSWGEAGEISIVGYASNLLPIPGGAVIRVSSLVGQSGSAKRPTQLTLLLAALWLGVALLIGGVGFLVLGSRGLGLAFCSGGSVLIILALFTVRSLKPEPGPRAFASRALVLEVGFVGLAVLRTYFAFRVVDVDAAVEASMVVAASNALSSSIGVVPAGLGVREGLAAILAGLTGILPAAGLLASVVLRITGMIVAVIGSAVMSAWRSKREPLRDPS